MYITKEGVEDKILFCVFIEGGPGVKAKVVTKRERPQSPPHSARDVKVRFHMVVGSLVIDFYNFSVMCYSIVWVECQPLCAVMTSHLVRILEKSCFT